jgi:hypothetical protein
LILLVVCITEPFNYLSQSVFVILLWVVAMVIRRVPGRFPTLLLIMLSLIVSCRYLWWRYTATLNWDSPLDLACGVLLLIAETYWLVLVFGYIQTCWPLNRPPAQLPRDTSLAYGRSVDRDVQRRPVHRTRHRVCRPRYRLAPRKAAYFDTRRWQPRRIPRVR